MTSAEEFVVQPVVDAAVERLITCTDYGRVVVADLSHHHEPAEEVFG